MKEHAHDSRGTRWLRYLVRRKRTLVREGPVILNELDPASARIVRALIEAKAAGPRTSGSRRRTVGSGCRQRLKQCGFSSAQIDAQIAARLAEPPPTVKTQPRAATADPKPVRVNWKDRSLAAEARLAEIEGARHE